MDGISSTETTRIGPPADQARVRLLLSGGGNRAMLGGAGAIAYLTQHDRWTTIDEVVSVSGGSTANAAVLTGGASSTSETFKALRLFFDRASTDLGQPWKQARRMHALGLILATVAAVVYLLLGVITVVPLPAILRSPAGGLGLGLIAPVAASALIRRGAAEYLRAYLGALTAGFGVQLDAAGTGDRQHVICASGLSTGHPYYLWSGGDFFYAGGDLAQPRIQHASSELWGSASQADHSVADAVFASSSLPTLARVSTPVPADTATAHEKELLIDGGVSGIFGLQVGSGLREQAAAGRRSAHTSGHVIVVDSGRHLKTTNGVGRALTRISISSLLARWLKVSLEANYRRDLADLDDAHLIRIAEGFDELGAEASNVVVRYNELRRRTAEMGLTNYNAERARNAFVTGWVGCALTLDPTCSTDTVATGLQRLGEEMRVGSLLSDHWSSLS